MQRFLDTIILHAAAPRWRQAAVLLCTTACVVGVPSVGYAKTMQEKMEIACAADVAKLCAGAKSDADALKACMLRHRAEASARCLTFFDASE